MQIIWNKVTPFSKIVALALFVALPFIGFWYGIQYEASLQALRAGATLSPALAPPYYSNVAAWQADVRADAGFSIAYPIDFNADDNYTLAPSPNWRVGAGPDESGVVAFTLAIPRALEPQTNFADAKLTVSYAGKGPAVANCLVPDASEGPAAATSSAMLHGIPFTVFASSGAGAGNLYETTSYRALHGGRCWAVEYTIHSTQIGNYPPQYGLQPFNKAYVAEVLARIVNTFSPGGSGS